MTVNPTNKLLLNFSRFCPPKLETYGSQGHLPHLELLVFKEKNERGYKTKIKELVKRKRRKVRLI